MQKRSDDDIDEMGEEVTAQNIRQYQYPPPRQQLTGQYPTMHNGFVQNHDLGHQAAALAGSNNQLVYPQHPTAQQRYVVHHQPSMQQHQQQQPQQQIYYQSFPQQQQNTYLNDVNPAIHQLTSAFINQVAANNLMDQQTAAHQIQINGNMKQNQAPSSRAINFDQVEKPITRADGQWLYQKMQPATNRTYEEIISLIDDKNNTSQRSQRKYQKVAASEQKVKQKQSTAIKRQKQSTIRNTVHNGAVTVYKRKEPSELQNAERKVDSKPTKKRRQCGSRQEKRTKIDRVAFGNGDKNGIPVDNKNGKKQTKPGGPLTAQKASNGSNDNPLVLAEDEQLVDAFVFFVMRQYKRCTNDGSQRSKRDLGYPGLECIHCTGNRKFFFRDAKTTKKEFSQLSKHLSECSGAGTIKETFSKLQNVRTTKGKNSESFFNNIWSRLHGHGDSRANEEGASVKKQVKSAKKTSKMTTIGPSESSLVLAEDKELVNDFIFTLMCQFRRCKLDLLKNKSSSQMKFDHGHPGLECLHCAGSKSRKFFYGSVESLNKNYAQLYKHVLTCGGAPAELKKSLETLKNEKHSTNQPGCRLIFFNAVWARLRHESDSEAKKKKENKKSMIKSKADEKTDKQQQSKLANDVSGRRACDECRSRRTKCDGKRWYCSYNSDSMATGNGANKYKTVSKRQPNSKKPREVVLSETTAAEDTFLCKVIPQDTTQISYPHAPMGQLWLNKSFAGSRSQSDLSDETSIDIHAGGTLIGRRYVWDEGYFVDQHHDVENKPSKKVHPILRGCTCGADHSYIMGAGTENDTEGMKSRRSERSGGSMRTSTVLSKLADGTLSPHTMIYPEEYTMGPELRFKKHLLAENVQPFSIRVSPDAMFLADLHAHLSDSEIIGFLGGHYSPQEKCIYIQAAFPCKATDRTDAGDTDVEMDPVSQIYAREAISNHGLSVVGWYHSHPTFQPNPSVTDIENQASYQQLFQSDNEKDNNGDDDDASTSTTTASPFVGLIIGTYDGQNPTSESVMRWFHVISKKAEGKDVNFPMQLKTTHRHFRVLDDELRPAMTSQGAVIRQDLESKFLSCPITKRSHPSQIETAELDTNTQSAASNIALREEKSQKKRPDYGRDVRVPNSSITEHAKDHKVTLIENDQPAFLLSESLFEKHKQGTETIRWKFRSAIPLYFTAAEKKILQMDADTISNDVLAGIIWFAVEREQMNPAKKGDSLLPVSVAPSSRAILELLLRLSFTDTDDMQHRLYEIIHSLESESKHDSSSDEMSFNDIDAVISHKVDAVLCHYYSSDQKRINPFKSWSGAGDKGKNIHIHTEINEADNPPSTSCSWAHYYFTEVLHMAYDEVDGRKVYKGGSKMQRGQKIAACLLRWARRMQLRPDFETVMSHKSCNEGDLEFDSETSTQQVAPIKNGYIFVVAEVMRLLAARWSEAAGNPPRQKRREGRRKVEE